MTAWLTGTSVTTSEPSGPMARWRNPHTRSRSAQSGLAHEQPTKADEEAMARILADASRRAARLPEDKQARPGLQVVAEAEAVKSAAAETAAPRENATTATAPSRRTPEERRADATLVVRPPALSPTSIPTSAATTPTGRGNGTALARPSEAPLPPRAVETQS